LDSSLAATFWQNDALAAGDTTVINIANQTMAERPGSNRRNDQRYS
jgi:hypothetical protein